MSCTPKFVDLVYIVLILGEKNGSENHSHYFIVSLEENLDLRSGKVFYYNSMKIFVDLEPQLLFLFCKQIKLYLYVKGSSLHLFLVVELIGKAPLSLVEHHVGKSEGTSMYI